MVSPGPCLQPEKEFLSFLLRGEIVHGPNCPEDPLRIWTGAQETQRRWCTHVSLGHKGKTSWGLCEPLQESGVRSPPSGVTLPLVQLPMALESVLALQPLPSLVTTDCSCRSGFPRGLHLHCWLEGAGWAGSGCFPAGAPAAHFDMKPFKWKSSFTKRKWLIMKTWMMLMRILFNFKSIVYSNSLIKGRKKNTGVLNLKSLFN